MSIKLTIGGVALLVSLAGSVVVRDRQLVSLISESESSSALKLDKEVSHLDRKIEQCVKRDELTLILNGINAIQIDVRALNRRIDKMYKP